MIIEFTQNPFCNILYMAYRRTKSEAKAHIFSRKSFAKKLIINVFNRFCVP